MILHSVVILTSLLFAAAAQAHNAPRFIDEYGAADDDLRWTKFERGRLWKPIGHRDQTAEVLFKVYTPLDTEIRWIRVWSNGWRGAKGDECKFELGERGPRLIQLRTWLPLPEYEP